MGWKWLIAACFLWLFNLQVPWFNSWRGRLYRLGLPRQVNLQPAQDALLQTRVRELEQENESLRRLLGAPLPADWPLLPAKILAAGEQRLIIGLGQKEGLAPGMNVMVLADGQNQSGIIIGKIATSDQYTASVEMIDGALVKTTGGAGGRISRQDGRLRLIEVEQKYGLKADDLVLTVGRDGWLPDLLVGRVGRIETIPTAIYQSAAIEPLVDILAIDQVIVVKLLFED